MAIKKKATLTTTHPISHMLNFLPALSSLAAFITQIPLLLLTHHAASSTQKAALVAPIIQTVAP
jgi:hypothetical protein